MPLKISHRVVSIFLVLLFQSCGLLSSKLDKSKYVERDKFLALESKYKELLKKHAPASPKEKVVEVEPMEVQLKEATTRTLSTRNYSPEDILRELRLLRNIESNIKQKKYSNALLLIKQLEGSEIEQIRTQARYFFGRLLFAQGEFDAASQIYEEVVFSMPFSIYAKRSLAQIITCYNKLGKSTKVEYFSKILQNFEGEKKL